MSGRQRVLQTGETDAQVRPRGGHVTHRERQALSTREVMERIGAPSLKAAYSWLYRHGIERDGYGRVDLLDVLRALKRRSGRGRHPNSLANLHRSPTRG